MQGPGAGPPRRGGMGCLFFVALAALLTIGLAPLLGCKDGKAPSCTTAKGYSGRGIKRKQTFSLALECAEGEGTTAPIWILSFGIFGAAMAFFVIALLLSRRRARA